MVPTNLFDLTGKVALLTGAYPTRLGWQGGVVGYAHSASGLQIDPVSAADWLVSQADSDQDRELNSDEAGPTVVFSKTYPRTAENFPEKLRICLTSGSSLTSNPFFLQKETPAGKVTESAHPARFSPDDKFSAQRVALKKRFGIYMPDTPQKPL